MQTADSSSAASIDVYKCPAALCVGLCQTVLQEGCDDYTVQLQSCPTGSVGNGAGTCCKEGGSGPLCSECEPDYSWSDDKVCVSCATPDYTRLCAVLLTFTAIAIFIVFSKHYQFEFSKVNVGKPNWKTKVSVSSPVLLRIACSTHCSLSALLYLRTKVQKTKRRWVIPLGHDLPKTQGSELQMLAFWLQTLCMLDLQDLPVIQYQQKPFHSIVTGTTEIDSRILENAIYTENILRMVARSRYLQTLTQIQPSRGAKECIYPAEPHIKFLFDVLGPPVLMTVIAVIAHATLCACVRYHERKVEKDDIVKAEAKAKMIADANKELNDGEDNASLQKQMSKTSSVVLSSLMLDRQSQISEKLAKVCAVTASALDVPSVV